MTIARRILGALLALTGIVWLGQGLDLIQGSSMTGSTFWAVVGALCLAGGLSCSAGHGGSPASGPSLERPILRIANWAHDGPAACR